MKQIESYQPKQSFIRLATACPEVRPTDIVYNTDQIARLYRQAVEAQASLITFPELSITGYTLGDLVQQTDLLTQAEVGLYQLAKETANQPTAMVVGLPLRIGNGLYNCGAVVADGSIKGIVPKSNLPSYNEFYESRWFQTWDQASTTIEINRQTVAFGSDLLFDIAGSLCAIEICEDLWVAEPPSGRLAKLGAEIIVNPSASPEQVGKTSYRRDLVRLQSGRLICAYAYAGCDFSESTAEVVMGGHQLISSNGQQLAERLPFGDQRLTLADVDTDHLRSDRRKRGMATELGGLIIKTEVDRNQQDLRAVIERNPFLPTESQSARTERLEAILNIQAHSLITRFKASRQERLVLGLSGGLDSTLALLVAHRAARIIGKSPAEMIDSLTMPSMANSSQTQTNAQRLAAELGVNNQVIPIDQLVQLSLKMLDHNGQTQDITYENVQARARTDLLFNYGNLHLGMVLGTGDLSEIALGWCTYNADQQSHYNVNGSIPKTLVKHLVAHLAQQPDLLAAQQTLTAILNTPISPELTSNDSSGTISQTTEEIIGPYELHDFFLNYRVRWGDQSAKIVYLATQAFADSYHVDEVMRWFKLFNKRFTSNQFKRENLPNSPKVGPVSLSPRGDWRMPPDLHNDALWNLNN